MPTTTESNLPSSNLLIARHDEITDLMDEAEQAFEKLKRTFAQPPETEGLELAMRLAISQVEVCLEVTYFAFTETSTLPG